jgi:phage shock protein A
MGLFDRIGGGLRKAMNAALAPAADPRQVYVNPYQKQRRLLDSVVEAIASVGESKSRLSAKVTEVRGQLDVLLEQAREELRAGRQDLARLALQRRQSAAAELAVLERQLAVVEREQADLKVVESKLAGQLEALAARQEVILARYSAAEAQVKIREAAAGVSGDLADLTAALRRAEDRTESMEARATAIERLVKEGMLADDDTDTPAALPPADVEAELARLQAEL